MRIFSILLLWLTFKFAFYAIYYAAPTTARPAPGGEVKLSGLQLFHTPRSKLYNTLALTAEDRRQDRIFQIFHGGINPQTQQLCGGAVAISSGKEQIVKFLETQNLPRNTMTFAECQRHSYERLLPPGSPTAVRAVVSGFKIDNPLDSNLKPECYSVTAVGLNPNQKGLCAYITMAPREYDVDVDKLHKLLEQRFSSKPECRGLGDRVTYEGRGHILYRVRSTRTVCQGYSDAKAAPPSVQFGHDPQTEGQSKTERPRSLRVVVTGFETITDGKPDCQPVMPGQVQPPHGHDPSGDCVMTMVTTRRYD